MVKAGYTIVEMTVVMGIIAVIFAISVSVIAVARDQQIVNDLGQQLVADIRKTQTRSISIDGACSDPVYRKPKMWALAIISDADSGRFGYEIKSLCIGDQGEGWSISSNNETVDLNDHGATLEVTPVLNTRYKTIVFSAPRGRAFLCDQTALNKDIESEGFGGEPSGDIDESLKPDADCPLLTEDLFLKIKRHEKEIVVKVDHDSGVASVQ